MKILVLRPEEQGLRTARALARRGHGAVLAPLLEVLPIAGTRLPASPSGYAAVIAASAHALSLLHPGDRSRLAGLPALVVGIRTAKAAEEAGLRLQRPSCRTARELAAALAGAAPRGRLLYLAGRDRRPEIEEALRREGRSFNLVEVYEAAVVSRLPEVAASTLRQGQIGAVLHYSARSARAYVSLAKARRMLPRALAPSQLCLSRAVAEPLLAAGAKRVEIASSPKEPHLLALLEVRPRRSRKPG
ncbi:MAG: uroporphyrinogen-III synthase [Hyphomicrobiales bacterium]|nr:uroporphyrinogen-III synthase [Hyphomicrobiales bacterium]MBV9976854.1 uroporphyrinogen-III synthase [Hyphomicrobiales bacterium]